MAKIGDEDDNNLQKMPVGSNPCLNPKPKYSISHAVAEIHHAETACGPPIPDSLCLLASEIASQPIRHSDRDVWGVLTAILSGLHQGLSMPLTKDEHIIGRAVADSLFQISSNHISYRHCKIYRKKVEVVGNQCRRYNYGFLKDTSTNGTYLNRRKLEKEGPEFRLYHGDVISLAAPAERILKDVTDSWLSKRKAEEEFGFETKRLRGTGNDASEGPISVDDFWSLRRSNKEQKNLKESISKTYLDELKKVRNLLEAKQKEVAKVHKITSEQKLTMADLNERLNACMHSCTKANEIVRSQEATICELKVLLDQEREQRKTDREKAAANLTASIQRVKAEAQEEVKRLRDASLSRETKQQKIINKLQAKKNLKESISKTYLHELERVRNLFEAKQKKVAEAHKITSEQKHAMADLYKRLDACMHSCTEANEIVRSKEADICELKLLLDQEREQRKTDQEKAAANFTASMQRVKAKAQEEVKRICDASLSRETKRQDQGLERERCSVVETLRFKLEDTRAKLIDSDNKVRQLEAQLSQELQDNSICKQRVEELEHENSRMRKELESKKAAVEEAWAKASAIELERNAAMRDLALERRRLKAARERITLGETQLRAFFSTSEEISVLFAKQRRQLDSMRVTLQDDDNGRGLDNDKRDETVSPARRKEISVYQRKREGRPVDSGTDARTRNGDRADKPDHDTRNHENRQEPGPGARGASGSKTDGSDGSRGWERSENVLEPKSRGLDGGIGRNESTGDTMRIENGKAAEGFEKRVETDVGNRNTEEDTEAGENESPGDGAAGKCSRSGGNGGDLRENGGDLCETGLRRNRREHRALAEMIGIVAPEMKNRFGGAAGSGCDPESDEKSVASVSVDEDSASDDDAGGASSGGESDGGRRSPDDDGYDSVG